MQQNTRGMQNMSVYFAAPERNCGNTERKIWKENLVWSGGEWYYDFTCLGKKLVVQMVAKELWYPFIPPSKGYVPVYPHYRHGL